jgi:hypothetical protein
MKNIIFKLAYLCALLVFVDTPIMAQTISQLLNDTRSFEVSACIPSKDNMISVWMEKRPERKDNSGDATNMRVAYKSTANNGKSWTEKSIVDLPNTFGTGNPFIASSANGEAYMVCMHIGNDFYSGNISFYEFDFKAKKFKLKSIAIESKENLLDKPSIAIDGDEIHLVYVAYSKKARNAVKYSMSKDKGKTWSTPINVFNEVNMSYLGPSVAMLKSKKVGVSIGAYGRKNVLFARKKMTPDSIVFEKPVIVGKLSDGIGAAMTELSTFDGKLMITWQNPHQTSEAWMSFSTDDGKTWAEPYKAVDKGNLLSAVFDKQGNIHCIYSDFGAQQFSVKYKFLNNKYGVLKEDFLMKSTPSSTFNEYLGAYQKLLISKNELFAFWIDYPNNSTLNFTRWKF